MISNILKPQLLPGQKILKISSKIFIINSKISLKKSKLKEFIQIHLGLELIRTLHAYLVLKVIQINLKLICLNGMKILLIHYLILLNNIITQNQLAMNITQISMELLFNFLLDSHLHQMDHMKIIFQIFILIINKF